MQILVTHIKFGTQPVHSFESQKNVSTIWHFGKISRIFWGTTLWLKIVLAEPKTRFYDSGLTLKVPPQLPKYVAIIFAKCLVQSTKDGHYGGRVVKTCLWFRKHNFWSQRGSSKYTENFAKTSFQIGRIFDQFFCYAKEWHGWVLDFVSATYICIYGKIRVVWNP